MKKILLSTMLCLTLNFAAAIDQAIFYYNIGNYNKAREWYEKAAIEGYSNAQNNLALMYANGQGVKQDYLKAKEWYEKAAIQGNSKAEFNLGVMYDKGEGVKQDYLKAKEWYEKAAMQGNSKAQRNLDILCSNKPWVCK